MRLVHEESEAARTLRTRVSRLSAQLSSPSDQLPLGDLQIGRPHDLLLTAALAPSAAGARQGASWVVVFLLAEAWDHAPALLRPFESRVEDGSALVIVIGTPRDLSAAKARGFFCALTPEPTAEEARLSLFRARELVESRSRAVDTGRSLRRYHSDAEELVEIARAMTTERDVDRLLGLILEKARFVTSADAGSIYVAEQRDAGPQLRFKLTQNDTVAFDSREFTVPVSKSSIAGCAALEKKPIEIADVYDLPAGSPFRFDRSFDERTTYRTKSMLTVPLISQRDEVIGVIQLINKKRERRVPLLSAADVEAQVVPFDEHSKRMLGMLAAQAGASLETALLYGEIHQLFAGFVRASVEAIESRDPTTSGHSRRVAELTLALAREVSESRAGPFRDASFSPADLRELEYACLLHDFGKIGVREKVLVKAKKLFDDELQIIRARFDFVAKSFEVDALKKKLRAIEKGATAELLALTDQELLAQLRELEASFSAIVSANEPQVLSSGDFARIEAIQNESFVDARGNPSGLLTGTEVLALKVRQGSLTASEMEEIRSHVTHTQRFLSQIPWGKSLSRVPFIAGSHHERPNGTGYPRRLRAEEIPLQSKMMSVADVFDALTAHDRPYKRAVPIERAIDILEYNVNDGHLDGELVRMFKEARIWEKAGISAG